MNINTKDKQDNHINNTDIDSDSVKLDKSSNENDDNILETSNIDDELNNLETMDIDNITKTAAVAAAAAAAAANVEEEEEDEEEVDIEENSKDVDTIENAIAAAKNEINENNVIAVANAAENIDNNNNNNNNSSDNNNANHLGNENSSNGLDNFFEPANSDVPFDQLLKNKNFYLLGKTEAVSDVKSMIEQLGGEISNQLERDSVVLARAASDAMDDNITDVYSFDLIYTIHRTRSIPTIDHYKIKKPPKLPGNIKINVGEFPKQKINNESIVMNQAQQNVLPPAPVPASTSLLPSSTNAGTDIGVNTDGNMTSALVESVKQLSESPDSNGNSEKNRKRTWSKVNKSKTNDYDIQFKTPKKKSNKFTEEEDEFILDLIRRNPNLRSTHSFFARIAQLPELSGHTGNSIRYRYRKILSEKLEYVYDIDPITNEVKIDPISKLPIKLIQIPSLLKSQYTAEEDYNLCKHIIDFKTNRRISPYEMKRKQDSSVIPEIVFQDLSSRFNRHSAMSWRDRYRKFAAKFGLQKYKDYYEDCLSKNNLPEPMKNMSSRNNRKDFKVDNFPSDEKSVKKAKVESIPINDGSLEALASVSVERQVNEQKIDIDEIKVNVEGNDLENDLGNRLVDSNATEKISKDGESADSEVKRGQNNGTGEARGNENKDDSKDEASQGANLFEEATADEMKQLMGAATTGDINNDGKDKNVHEALKANVGGSNDIKRVREEDYQDDKDTKQQSEVSNNQREQITELEDLREEDSLMNYRQLVEIDPEPLKNREFIDLNRTIEYVQKCFESFTVGNMSTFELFKTINDKTGLSILWLNYWFDCSCGMLITFMEAIIHYLKTGELSLNGVSGFWTEKDDELLREDPENEKLIELHGKESVAKRKSVLFGHPMETSV